MATQRERTPGSERTPGYPTLLSLRRSIHDGAICGTAGASAMVIQVALMMPVDTMIMMQYRYGRGPSETFSRLLANGGARRLYSGIAPALVQGPLARFGDTATNAAAMTCLDSADKTHEWPTILKTTSASVLAATWRVLLMPLDVSKTVFQLYGVTKGLAELRRRSYGGFYFGSAAAFTTSFAGHVPWYTTFNELDARLPRGETQSQILMRYAVVGFSASVVSDSITNALRVLKAIRQAEGSTYREALRIVVSKDGFYGLVTRGLRMRIVANSLQSVFFTIVWKTFEEYALARAAKDRP